MKQLSKIMTFEEYQQSAMKFAEYPRDCACTYPAIGLNGEAGEVAEKIKKVLRDQNGVISDKEISEIAKELGDVLWYVCAFAQDLGISLEEVARLNIEKLSSRKERGTLHGSGDNR